MSGWFWDADVIGVHPPFGRFVRVVDHSIHLSAPFDKKTRAFELPVLHAMCSGVVPGHPGTFGAAFASRRRRTIEGSTHSSAATYSGLR